MGKGLYKGGFLPRKGENNLAGEWGKGFREPLWIISTIEPEEALEIYKAWVKIEQSFKDLKSLLHLENIMNKNREKMERMVTMMFIAYAIGLLLCLCLQPCLLCVGIL